MIAYRDAFIQRGVIRSQHRVDFLYIPNQALYYKIALFGS